MESLGKRSALCALLMIMIALGGCSGGNGRPLADPEVDLDETGASGQGGYWGWDERVDEPTDAGLPASPELPEPFSHDFDALITQSVRWGALDVSVIAVRQVRGIEGESRTDTGGLIGETFIDRLSSTKIYVEMEFELANRGAKERGFQHRDTWDLILADGTRLHSVDGFTLNILPDDVATAMLHFEVVDEISLDGAVLELNGEDRSALEPEELPLDSLYEAKFPRRISTMAGQVVQFVGTESIPDDATVDIDEAVYDVNFGRTERVERGQRFVWLDLAFTPNDDNGGYFNASQLRVIVDGRAEQPVDLQHGSIAGGTTEVFHVHFSIDAGAQSFEIMFPDGTPQGTRFPVNVSDTVLATDIP